MTTSKLSTGAWISLDERCPVQHHIDGSDLAHLVIGDEDHSVELLLNAESMRKLATISAQAAAEMDALFAQEDAEREAAQARQPAASGGDTA